MQRKPYNKETMLAETQVMRRISSTKIPDGSKEQHRPLTPQIGKKLSVLMNERFRSDEKRYENESNQLDLLSVFKSHKSKQ